MDVRWSDSARADFDRAIAYLEKRGPSGAMRVGLRILRAVDLLEHFPELAPASRHRGLRQLVVPQTPYLVVYRLHQQNIEIRAVIHVRRKRRR